MTPMIDRIQGTVRPAEGAVVPHAGQKQAFAEVFRQTQAGLKFSAHAQSRLASRQIVMGPEMIGKLDKAVEGAAKKGSKNSLVLLSDLAFIVNIPNRTVITAMDGATMKDNIVTNIDSTVIAD